MQAEQLHQARGERGRDPTEHTDERPSAIAEMVPVASSQLDAMMEPQRMVVSRAYVTE